MRTTKIIRDARSPEEREWSSDLDVFGYSGKWKSAKEMALQKFPLGRLSEYWSEARRLFIALGGQYLRGGKRYGMDCA